MGIGAQYTFDCFSPNILNNMVTTRAMAAAARLRKSRKPRKPRKKSHKPRKTRKDAGKRRIQPTVAEMFNRNPLTGRKWKACKPGYERHYSEANGISRCRIFPDYKDRRGNPHKICGPGEVHNYVTGRCIQLAAYLRAVAARYRAIRKRSKFVLTTLKAYRGGAPMPKKEHRSPRVYKYRPRKKKAPKSSSHSSHKSKSHSSHKSKSRRSGKRRGLRARKHASGFYKV